jgi:Regulator of Chromosome Condensation (RCC1) repeat protein/regulator of chromosome condensation (RCC1) repeat-containing protein
MSRSIWIPVLLALAQVACTEFPNEPVKTATLQPVGWAAVSVTDVDTISVQALLSGGTTLVTGLRVTWQSSNSAVLRVVQVQAPVGGSLEDTLAAQLRAEVTGMSGGVDTVSVLIEGGGAFEPVQVQDTIRVLQKWVEVSAGYDHSCGVTVDQKAFCWGAGRLGDGSDIGNSTPSLVLGQLTFKTVSSGLGHTCGLAKGPGIAYCWGENQYGGVGNNTQIDQLIPVPVSAGFTFKSVMAGLRYACGLSQSSVAYCWGFDRLQQLGDFAPPAQRPVPDPILSNCDGINSRCALTPVPVRTTIDPAQAVKFSEVAPGLGWFTCGILADSTAACWGLIPLVTSGDFFNPPSCSGSACLVAVPSGYHFSSLSVGQEHACGLTGSRRLYCWGMNSFGELGTGMGSDTLPRLVSGGVTYLQVSAGVSSSCAVATDFTVWCWGSGAVGQLGSGSGSSPTPVPVNGALKFAQVSVGSEHACGVTLEGRAYCWGRADQGQLGNGSISGSQQCGGVACSTAPVLVREPL